MKRKSLVWEGEFGAWLGVSASRAIVVRKRRRGNFIGFELSLIIDEPQETLHGDRIRHACRTS
jgi:hypothetical protein